MIVFLRHAERGDNQLPMRLSQIQYDPPIIQQSISTVSQTSLQLHQIFQKHGIKQFIILSSKFLRCLMTAKLFQQNLQKYGYVMKDNCYYVDNRIGEYLREDWFKEYPMNNLIYHSEYLQKYINIKQFQQVVKQKQLRNNTKEFPQNYIKFHYRVANFKKQLKFPQENTCLLIVTHGFVVRQLCFTMNQLPFYQNQIKYCGYAAYVKDKNGQKLVKAKL